jgi:UDP-N-acetyl-D-glucosamine dehydrogenase
MDKTTNIDVTTKLVAHFGSKQVKLGVVGLGYVGLPICLAATNCGLEVLGFDTDPAKPAALHRGESYLRHISAASVAAAIGTKRFSATSDLARLNEPDALLICVPTPLTVHLEPDLSFVISTAETIAQHVRRGQLVILESTTYPGTTSELLRPILEKSGLACDHDFFVAFSPEREDPGNVHFATSSIPKVVGADTSAALELAVTLYAHFFTQIVKVSTTRTAEAVKLTENIFRAVNIALVNELKVVYSAMDVDIWEVIDAAKTKPFGFMPFYPGPGLGGHCIPIDPFYLTWKAREYGIATRFIELAGQINSGMPQHVVNKLAFALDTNEKKGLNGSRILVLGVAYKKNVDDMRESPALQIIELLEARSAIVEFYDPFVAEIPLTRAHPNLASRRSTSWSETLSRKYDAVLIVTDHDGVDYEALVKVASLVIDTRNVCRRIGLASSNIVLA